MFEEHPGVAGLLDREVEIGFNFAVDRVGGVVPDDLPVGEKTPMLMLNLGSSWALDVPATVNNIKSHITLIGPS